MVTLTIWDARRMRARRLHDVGWSRVPLNLQMSKDKAKKIKALELHLEHAPRIIEEILTNIGYDEGQIKRAIDVVSTHQFKNPKQLDKQLLIDADALSDVFKEQFYQ